MSKLRIEFWLSLSTLYMTIFELSELRQRLAKKLKYPDGYPPSFIKLNLDEGYLIQDLITENINFREHYKKEKK